MTVITFSREFGSGGDEIADRVHEILGYRQFNKLQIAQAAVQAGFSASDVIDYSEENHKVTTFLERLFGRSSSVAQVLVWVEDPTGVRTSEKMDLGEDAALQLVRKAVQVACQAGDVIIVGRGGQMILKDEPGVLHVRVVAPLEDRIQRVKTKMKTAQQSYQADIDIRRAAQDLIGARDLASADYIRRFYGGDWADPLLYHLVLNTSKVSIEQAAQIIVEMAHTMQPVVIPT